MRRLYLAFACGLLLVLCSACRRDDITPEQVLEERIAQDEKARQVVANIGSEDWTDGEDPDYTQE